MNALVISSRFPWPAHTGDRLRTEIWIDALATIGRVTLVAPSGRVDPRLEAIAHVALQRRRRNWIPALARALRESIPVHTAMAAGFDWTRALEEAERKGGPFDVAVVLLPRCAPWIDKHIVADRLILDAVDSLSRGMEERERASRSPLRRFWRFEARAARRLETGLAERYERVVVVNGDEASRFGNRTEVVPNGVEILAPGTRDRTFDFAFWGYLPYFANRDALDILLTAVWPRIRRIIPSATLLIGGAAAPPDVLRLDGHDGIRVLSPIGDRPSVLREVRIALLPLRYGSGHSNKALEAAEAGCAIAGTPVAFRGLDDLLDGQICESDPERLAQRSATLALDETARAAAGAAARRTAESSHDRSKVLDRLRAIATGGGTR